MNRNNLKAVARTTALRMVTQLEAIEMTVKELRKQLEFLEDIGKGDFIVIFLSDKMEYEEVERTQVDDDGVVELQRR